MTQKIMRKALVIHPFLFAIFPVLFLYAHNVGLFLPDVLFAPIAIMVFLALGLWSLLSLVLKEGTRAGLIVSLFFVLFFSYESFFVIMRDLMLEMLGAYIFGTRAYIMLAWAVLFGLGTLFLVRTRSNLHGLTNIANVVGGCLILISLINIGTYGVKTASARRELGRTSVHVNPLGSEPLDALPNIYYIILDEYGRADVLQELYQYDNSRFLEYLTGKGFYVADASRSNYCQTFLSLASSLNMTYLNRLVSDVGVESDAHWLLYDMIGNSAVVSSLKHHGYEIVAFSSGYYLTEMRNADTYLAPPLDLLLNEFHLGLIEITPFAFPADQLGIGADLRRERIVYSFGGLADISELQGPVFVFAHIMAPHPPFVFGPHGEPLDANHLFDQVERPNAHGLKRYGTPWRERYVQLYGDQLTFLNARIRTMVDGILSTSDRPTVIILQADTGPASMLDRHNPDNTHLTERFSILNAYYVPNSSGTQFYDGISPVNTFRIILNHYLGTDYELLEDNSYFSSPTSPYKFVDVTNEVNLDTDVYDPL